MSKWNLQLPIGDPGSPTTIKSSSLQGCSGYQNTKYFYSEADGSMTMKVPGSVDSCGCVTTKNSKHCRTELSENGNSWNPKASQNRLKVTLTAVQPDDGSYGTVIGQVKMDDSISSKPVCELFYGADGTISMGVEQTKDGGDEIVTTLGKIPVGQKFTYEIRYENNVLQVAINDQGFTKLSTYSLNAPLSYFKVGNYNQGDVPSNIRFYTISVTHKA